MEIAIMGAGLSGLACALTLEQKGLNPIIFEKRKEVGDRFVNGEILLTPLSFPIDDPVQYLSKKFDLSLKPISPINKLIIYSKNKKAVVEGQLGFTTNRGRVYNSWEKQMARQVKSKIIFNSKYTYQELNQNFSHLMISTGDAEYAEKINNFKTDLTVCLKGAIIPGNFKLDTVMAWLNTDIAPGGYGYLIPIAKNKANIVIGIPELKESPPVNLELYWKNFCSEVSSILESQIKIESHFQVSGYMIGSCYKPRIGNTLFLGNNFGAIMPFLGFGQFPSLLTGIYAAQDISGEDRYTNLTTALAQSYRDSIVLRKTMEKMKNRHFDKLVSLLNTRAGQRIFTGSINYLGAVSKVLRPFIK